MGQYYKPIAIAEDGSLEHVYSHDYDNGLKLMEHSWIGNGFVDAVMYLIMKAGRWYGRKIVWAGDYADPEKNGTDENDNLYSRVGDTSIKPRYFDDEIKGLRYLVNLDTNEFVDIKKSPKIKYAWLSKDDDGWAIHPLPLLTCEGNNRGGGDFRGSDPKELIGRWARNRITVQKAKPAGKKELIFDLTE